MKRVTSPVISTFMQDFHRGRGVDIRVGARMAAIEGDGKVAEREALRRHGACRPISCCLRSAPRPTTTSPPLRASTCEDGVVVDEHGRTADPSVYAAGDCTRFPSTALWRARCASNACRTRSIRPRPWRQRNASASRSSMIRCRGSGPDQYELKLQMAGISDGYDDAQTVGDVAAATLLGRVPQGRKADRGRCRERRPRLHERPQADRRGHAGRLTCASRHSPEALLG